MAGNPLLTLIEKRSFNLILYGWVAGVQYNLPGASLEECVETFFRHYKLDATKYTREAATRAFTRMKKELMKCEQDFKNITSENIDVK